MRCNIFVALVVATFVVCYTSLASAENVALTNNTGNVARRLRAEAGINQENVARIAGGFITKVKENAALTKAVNMVKNANGDETAVRNAINLAAGAKEAAKLSDDSIAKLSAMMAQSVKTNPKSWPRLRKYAKIMLGVNVGGLAIYGAYKLLFDRGSSTSAPATTTTTTTGSA